MTDIPRPPARIVSSALPATLDAHYLLIERHLGELTTLASDVLAFEEAEVQATEGNASWRHKQDYFTMVGVSSVLMDRPDLEKGIRSRLPKIKQAFEALSRRSNDDEIVMIVDQLLCTKSPPYGINPDTINRFSQIVCADIKELKPSVHELQIASRNMRRKHKVLNIPDLVKELTAARTQVRTQHELLHCIEKGEPDADLEPIERMILRPEQKRG
jgi:hypothetical protein